MKEFRFYTKGEGYSATWWIDLPEYVEEGGDPLDLQMVAGADEFLNNLTPKGHTEVKLQITEQKTKGFFELKRCDEIPTISGRYYFDDSSDSLMWLCNVTLWVFKGVFPETIYYKKV